MKGENEQSSKIFDDARVKTITDKRKTLEDNFIQIRCKVTECFNQLSNSLKIREKQLLRQIEAVHNQQLSIIQSNWELLPSVPSININLDNWQHLESSILKLGRVELPDKDGIVVKDAEPYKVEEYEEANNDHISFDKSIQLETNTDIVINLGERINFITDGNDTHLPSSSTDTNVELKEARVDKKIEEIENNNCSLWCSPVLESSTNITDESGDTLRLAISKINSCHLFTNSLEQEAFVKTTPDPGVNLNSSTTDEEKILQTPEIKKDDYHNEMPLDDDLNKILESPNNNEKIERDEHPIQIQQWLQQILVETETEPVIHEIEQFAEISKSRYRELDCSLKT